MIELNTVVIEGERGLYARLSELADHRKPKGIRHKLAAVLVICAAAMLCGARSVREIAEWAADLDDEARARLYCRRSPKTGRLVVPSEKTVQRHLGKEGLLPFPWVVSGGHAVTARRS